MKKFITLLTLLIIIAGAIYAGSPYYSAYQLKNAYDAKDGAAIAQAIDYNRLRPNLQNQLKSKFSATLTQYPMVAKLGGQPLTDTANTFIDKSVQGAITPDNIENLIKTQNQVNQSTKELAAAWAIASNQVDLRQLIQQLIVQQGDIDAVLKTQIELMMTKQAEQMALQAQTGEDGTHTQLGYCGLDCFYIAGVIKGYPVKVEMARDRLIHWKVVDVQLP